VEWYGNTRRIVPCTEKSNQAAGGSKAVERLLTSQSRRKQPAHVYSALFYNTLVKPHLDYAAYKASLEPGTTPDSEFAYRNSCIREAWEKAPPDIVEQVTEYKALLEMSIEELEGLLGDTGLQGGSGTAVASSMDEPNKDHTPGASQMGAPASEAGLGEASSEGLTGDKASAEEELGDNPKNLEGLIAIGDRAASMYKSAIRETLQMKKMDDREKYVFISYACLGLSLNSLTGQSRTFTTEQLGS
jgi:hypothetical protein